MGDQFIDVIPTRFRRAILDKRITRLMKSESGATFEPISNVADVIKLAGRGGAFDLENEYGVSGDRVTALDRATRLAMAVGLDALRDAGIPLVLRYKTTTKGTQLHDRWALPEAMRDDTGVIFASVFPGYDSFAQEAARYYADHARREQLTVLEDLRARLDAANGHSNLGQEIDRRINDLRTAIEKDPYVFDRRFILRVLSMGHSQFAEFIGARGPNTQVNAACASTPQAVSMAEDWIRTGRCRRVIIVSADDITSDNLLEWMGSGFLASGAAATTEVVEETALPFDRRRHGMVTGMGAAALVVESAEAARERGIRPICEVLGAITANSAFHGTRLDVEHIAGVMEKLVSQAETRGGIERHQIAPHMAFVSHETYTPARGGSASAEINALRQVFGDSADQIVITNTKGFTGHAMGAGIEDVVAVKALETGWVPPVANFKEVDPELGPLNLSKGGVYPVEYTLRLGAGFGSQISMTLMRWAGTKDGVRPSPDALGYATRIVDRDAWNTWLSRMAGYPTVDLEVVKHTLRVRDHGQVAATARVAKAAQDSRPSAAPAPQRQLPTPTPVVKSVAAPALKKVAELEVKVQAAAPVASPKPAVAAKPAAQSDPVKDRVLAVVAEKTGYPIDMLDLDLDLEADLGVDTVKQAEVFAAIREAYGIERDDKIKLREFPTLTHVIQFVYDRRPDLKVKPVPVAVAAKQELESPIPVTAAKPVQKATDPVQERILTLAVEKTGYPRDMLELDLDLEADLGVDTVKQAEMFAAIREIYRIPREENLKLRDFPTLAHVIQFVRDHRPDLAIEGPVPVATAAKEEDRSTIPAPVTPAQDVTDPVKERVLALAVEKTGYPKDMLELDLDLEADLGVDTVKQAEMFAAIREIYNIPRDENRKLRDYPTLAHVIQFVHEQRPDLTVEAPTPVTVAAEKPWEKKEESKPAAVAAVPNEVNTSDPVKERIHDLAVDKTGYPREMLELDLDLEADLGVDTVKQAEMFAAIREIYNIPRDENRKLRDYPTLGHVIRFVYEQRPDLAVETLVPVAAEKTQDKEEGKPVMQRAAAVPEGITVADPVQERILDLAVDKTGYPREMLELDLDLEADLGVDTVKQAEMFAAIRESYNIPRDENRKLRDYPTLGQVIRFVYEMRPDLAPSSAPPSPTVAEPSAPVPVAAGLTTGDPIQVKVLEIAAEKTGYPRDMLELDLDLEADLGIDTVKQAEMFAAIRAAYNIPRDENLNLRDFPTLAHVIRFAREKQADGASELSPAATEAQQETDEKPSAAPAPLSRPVLASLDAANSIPRRVPVPNLRPPLSLCKSTGVALGAGSRVVIMSDKNGTAAVLAEWLRTAGAEVLMVEDTPDVETLVNRLKDWLATGPIQGVYWLPALDNEGSLNDMDLGAWREALRVRVKSLFTTMRGLYEQVASPNSFLISATRLGGQHGYNETGATTPLGGGVVGFTKAYKRERPDALIKAVDFEAERSTSEIAEILIEETLRDPGAVEIGYKEGLRWTVGLEEQPAADGQPGLILDKDTIFLVTGAAGSIVSAITADLAAASGGKFYLLDLVAEPDPGNADLRRFVSDKDGLKRDLFARIQARGERATPALVEKELAGLERLQAALSAIEAVKAAGGMVHYYSVNLTDADAVAKIIGEIREESGRIDVLLHAAGIERSHFLPDKDPREFDLVFDVKSDGWFNLLHAIGEMPLGATVAFSSIAGRFGNGGQTDYSSANDLLCKITSSFRTTHPATRGIVIDWTAWGGIGMASRGSIPKMMEMAGIDMLPPEAGIPLIRRELTAGATRGEVVVAKRLGILVKEFDSTGGLDVGAGLVPAQGHPQGAPLQDTLVYGPMIGTIAGMTLSSGLTIETTLDPKIQPFLYDHQIDGTPVLPGVMGVEAFAEAALAMLPGWQMEAVEEVNYMSPFKFYRNEPRTVTVEAVIRPDQGALVADCKLIGRRQLPNQTEPQITAHFAGRVRLTRQLRDVGAAPAVSAPAGPLVEASDIYQVYFHGPAYQVVRRAWRDGEQIIGEMREDLPSNHHPSERPIAMAPRLIELCFQTAGLWEMSMQNRMGLPLHIDQVCLWRSPDLAEGRVLYAVVTPDVDRGSFDADVVDSIGNRYVHLRGYRTVALPDPIDFEPLKVLQAVTA